MKKKNMERKDFESVESFDKIKTLMDLRWFTNIHGFEMAAEKLNVDIKTLKFLKRIQIPTDTDITNYYSCSIDELKYIEEEESFYNLKYSEISPSHRRALNKNEKLKKSLSNARDNFLTIGTNKTKRRLNKLSISDIVAKATRIALEIEDKNIQAKKSFGVYKEDIYYQKEKLIIELINIFKEQDNWAYGVENKDGRETNSIVYFEIPNCEQISWHTTLRNSQTIDIPLYNKPWDEKENSTLKKLEEKIKRDYPEIIY